MKFLRRGKIILVPYPAQGHVNPMLKLASVLVNHGLEPVLVTPEFIHHRVSTKINPDLDGIRCMSIPDGLEQGKPRDFFAIEMAMEKNMPFHLERLVLELDEEDGHGGSVACMVVDLLASYAIGVANRCGVQVAGFWPAMLATYKLISAIPDMIEASIISETGCPLHEAPMCFSPGQPAMSADELPWLIGTSAARKSRFKFWTRTLERSVTLPWLLVNTFHGEQFHPTATNNINSQNYPLIFPIQPTNMHARSSFWEEDLSCLDWLDKQNAGSVVYVSFGSWVSPIGEAKVKSLALALEASKRPFLWVLGPAWLQGLPGGYFERVSKHEQGKIVSWAPQMDVLQHKSVGCYLTHCGWNSTIEAIQCKKLLLCYPVAGDQFLNCAYIVKAWRIGTKISGFGKKDLEQGLKRVMENSEMSNRILELNERVMGKESSHRAVANLTSFIHNLKIRSERCQVLEH